MTHPIWGEPLRQARQAAGLSLRQLGRLLGVSFSTLARLERGEGAPDQHTRHALTQWRHPERPVLPCPCPRCYDTALVSRVAALEQRVAALEAQRRQP